MASEKITAMIEELKTLTVLELSELVKAVEEEFGVSAAAAVAVAAPAAGAAAAAEEKTEFDVILAEAGAERLRLLRQFVKSQVLALQKQRHLLMALLKPLRKLQAKKTLKQSRLSLKKLAQRLSLSNFKLQQNLTPDQMVGGLFLFVFNCLKELFKPTTIYRICGA